MGFRCQNDWGTWIGLECPACGEYDAVAVCVDGSAPDNPRCEKCGKEFEDGGYKLTPITKEGER